MMCDPVGEREIAERLGVKVGTVAMWNFRGTRVPFPEPRWTVSANPAWDWPDIEAWARRTERLPTPKAPARGARRGGKRQ